MFVTNGGNNNTGWTNKSYAISLQAASETTQQRGSSCLLSGENSIRRTTGSLIYYDKKLVSEKVLVKDKDSKWIPYAGTFEPLIKQFGMAK